MKKLAVLILCLCLFPSFSLAQSEKTGAKASGSKSATRKGFPNIFRPVEGLFKWIFGGFIIDHVQIPVSVKSLSLNKSEIDYPVNNQLGSSNDSQTIEIVSEIHNPKKKKINYYYVVTVGKITHQGTKVFWDLSGVMPGKYAITAAVEDECGVCGFTQTKTVTVK